MKIEPAHADSFFVSFSSSMLSSTVRQSIDMVHAAGSPEFLSVPQPIAKLLLKKRKQQRIIAILFLIFISYFIISFLIYPAHFLYLYIATVEDIRIFYCCLFLFDSYFYFFCNFPRFYRNCNFTFFLCFHHTVFRNGCDLLIRSGVGNLLLGSDWSNNWF